MGNIQNARTVSEKVLKRDREIQAYFGQETDEVLSMDMEGVVYTLVRIDPEDQQNIRKFAPYCHGSPAGKYGVIWKAWCVEDRYVFDTREYAVDFIVMSRAVGRG